ncbi:MAG TPA: hypothetical protein VFW83_10595 [Bryobacteraceae bacterium]|nr:hypothetical protein [Bryobacteraceae bacterium]
MRDDLRVPIGIFFAIVGIVLIALPHARAPLTAGPANLYAGIAMLVFGGAMLGLAVRAARGSGRRS